MSKSISTAILLLLIVFSKSVAQDSEGPVRPMPPTNLRAFDVKAPDATVEALNIYFNRFGAAVSEESRNQLLDILREFSNADLEYLAGGTTPELLGIRKVGPLLDSDWRPLVAAYASAELIDRARFDDRRWSIFLLVFGCILGIIGTKTFEKLVERQKKSAN